MRGESGFWSGDTAFTNTVRPSSRSQRLASDGEWPPRRFTADTTRGRAVISELRQASETSAASAGAAERTTVSRVSRRAVSEDRSQVGKIVAAVSSATAFIAGASSASTNPASTA